MDETKCACVMGPVIYFCIGKTCFCLGSIQKADLAVKGVDAVPTSEGEVLQELLSHIA